MRHDRFVSVTFAMVLSAAGCGSLPGEGTLPDDGMLSSPRDGGPLGDASTVVDAGPIPDAGPPVDAGPDAGAEPQIFTSCRLRGLTVTCSLSADPEPAFVDDEYAASLSLSLSDLPAEELTLSGRLAVAASCGSTPLSRPVGAEATDRFAVEPALITGGAASFHQFGPCFGPERRLGTADLSGVLVPVEGCVEVDAVVESGDDLPHFDEVAIQGTACPE